MKHLFHLHFVRCKRTDSKVPEFYSSIYIRHAIRMRAIYIARFWARIGVQLYARVSVCVCVSDGLPSNVYHPRSILSLNCFFFHSTVPKTHSPNNSDDGKNKANFRASECLFWNGTICLHLPSNHVTTRHFSQNWLSWFAVFLQTISGIGCVLENKGNIRTQTHQNQTECLAVFFTIRKLWGNNSIWGG